jgi:AcrR family transcriptional regulator
LQGLQLLHTLQFVSTGEDRRERRRVARRAAIRGIAIRLALDEGLGAATVDAISAAADISPRTFFNYFPSKDDVFSIEPRQWTTEEIVAELRARPAGEAPVESMRAVVTVMADAAGFAHFAEESELLQELYRRHPELFGKMRVDKAGITIAALITEIAARTGRDPATDLYPGMLVNAAFAALQTAENAARISERALPELLDDAFDLLIRGL